MSRLMIRGKTSERSAPKEHRCKLPGGGDGCLIYPEYQECGTCPEEPLGGGTIILRPKAAAGNSRYPIGTPYADKQPITERNYGAYQAMGRGGFGLGRQGPVGREYGDIYRVVDEPGTVSVSRAPITEHQRIYGDVGPGGEAGVQTVPWPAERGYNAFISKEPITKYRKHSKAPISGAPMVTRKVRECVPEMYCKKWQTWPSGQSTCAETGSKYSFATSTKVP